MKKYSFTYNMRKISDVTGVPITTVRLHRRNGMFELKDFLSVCGYVVGSVLRAGEFSHHARKRPFEQVVEAVSQAQKVGVLQDQLVKDN